MRVPYIAISDKRCTIQISGCNFRCRGCFSKARYLYGRKVVTTELIEHIPKYKEVLVAGGEPTIYKNGLLSLINELSNRKVILATNGYLLDQKYIKDLGDLKVHIDLKAFTPSLHKWYTGKSNERVLNAIKLLYENSVDFEVETVYIPDIVDTNEISKIAQFLSYIGNIRYKIIRYIPANNLSRRPTIPEIEKAVEVAKRYLKNVVSSIDVKSHPKKREIIEL